MKSALWESLTAMFCITLKMEKNEAPSDYSLTNLAPLHKVITLT